MGSKLGHRRTPWITSAGQFVGPAQPERASQDEDGGAHGASCTTSAPLYNPAMPDARLLREITDALRALKDRADAAGSTTARSMLGMTAEAMHELALEAERKVEMPARRPGQMARRLGEG